jgi:Mg2+ and Co2+ transporter CorA
VCLLLLLLLPLLSFFCSAAAQLVYMSDVQDHISTIVEDMETLAEDARDLIDLVFNTIGEQCSTNQLLYV